MAHIQILENENHTSLADFNNNEVWILNCNSIHVDDRIINCSSVTDMNKPLSYKFPLLLQEIIALHGKNFTYEVITDNADNFSFKAYTCDYEKIKVVGK